MARRVLRRGPAPAAPAVGRPWRARARAGQPRRARRPGRHRPGRGRVRAHRAGAPRRHARHGRQRGAHGRGRPEGRGTDQAVRRHRRGGEPEPRAAPRHHHRAGRPERRRQDDRVQPAHPRHPSRHRRRDPAWQGHQRSAARPGGQGRDSVVVPVCARLPPADVAAECAARHPGADRRVRGGPVPAPRRDREGGAGAASQGAGVALLRRDAGVRRRPVRRWPSASRSSSTWPVCWPPRPTWCCWRSRPPASTRSGSR